MGTSNLYKGPKSTILLPPDYEDGDTPIGSNLPIDDKDSPDQNDGQKDNLETPTDKKEDENELNGAPLPNAASLWRSARKSYNSYVTGRATNAKPVVKAYTRALGGHRNAARQLKSARQTTADLISFFSGDSSQIRQRIKKSGIQIEGRSTQEIFDDIYRILSTDGASRDDAIVNEALTDTFGELYADPIFSPDLLDIFNGEILQFLVCHFVKNEIYKKLIEELSYSSLSKDFSIGKLKDIEQKIKKYISSIVENVVPDYLNKDYNADALKICVMDIYDNCYKVMEELKNE